MRWSHQAHGDRVQRAVAVRIADRQRGRQPDDGVAMQRPVENETALEGEVPSDWLFSRHWRRLATMGARDPDTATSPVLTSATVRRPHRTSTAGGGWGACVAAAAVLFLSPTTKAPAQQACVGDCDDSRAVMVNELVRGGSSSLGSTPLGDCPAFDSNGNGVVAIDELLLAVGQALFGCGVTPPTPLDTPTRSPTVSASPSDTATASATPTHTVG